MVDESDSLTTRRKFVKCAGIGIGSLTLPVAGSAAAQSSTPGAEEIGIEKEVQELIRKEKFDQATTLLSENEVEYDASVSTLRNKQSNPRNKSSQSNVSISPDSVFGKGKSHFSHISWNRYGSVYRSKTDWTLRTVDRYIDTPGPRDGIGLTVSDYLWEPYLDTLGFDDRSKLGDRGPNGAICKFNDPNTGLTGTPKKKRTGWMRLDFNKLQGGNHDIYGSYRHTWNVGGAPGWLTFILSAGPIGINAASSVDNWIQRDDNTL